MRKIPKQVIEELLSTGLSKYKRQTARDLLNALVNELTKNTSINSSLSHEAIVINVLTFLISKIDETFKLLYAFKKACNDFLESYSQCTTLAERQQAILKFAQSLDASHSLLAADKKAFKRWFDYNAILERYDAQRGEIEYNASFFVDRFSSLIIPLINHKDKEYVTPALTLLENFEKLIIPLLGHDDYSKLRTTILESTADIISYLDHSTIFHTSLSAKLDSIIFMASNRELNVWVQVAALKLLKQLSSNFFEQTVLKRLKNPGTGEDIFVRKKIVLLLAEDESCLIPIIPIILNDPSAFVRQALANVYPLKNKQLVDDFLNLILHQDPNVTVRAQAVMRLPSVLADPANRKSGVQAIFQVFESESEDLRLRILLDQLINCLQALTGEMDEASMIQEVNLWISRLTDRQLRSQQVKFHRYIALTKERIFCHFSPQASSLKHLLLPIIRSIKPGSSTDLPLKILQKYPEDLFGRTLSVLSQQDFGLSLIKNFGGYRLARGDVFGFRFWRLFYEITHLRTDKRENFNHTIGRKNKGYLRAPSGILAEMTETSVPGEPLYIENEGGWRPFLPLVDDVLSIMLDTKLKKPVKFFSSNGITELTPPSLIKRLIVALKLTFRFSSLAKLRNWKPGLTAKKTQYIDELKKMGVNIQFKPHDHKIDSGTTTSSETPFEQPTDRTVSSFFRSAVPLAIPTTGTFSWESWKHFFYSVYFNSINDISLFLSFVAICFILRHFYLNFIVNKDRSFIPLAIGVAGTRGKTSTARLLASGILATGESAITKSTGCEPVMSLNHYCAKNFAEITIYRPLEKFSIWEQTDVLHYAKSIKSRVFLWESMGIDPKFLKILSNWMQSNIAMITNVFPDHEDFQGPAGINIADSMTSFIPGSALLATSEESMLPPLAYCAQAENIPIVLTTWREAALVDTDALKNFFYFEEPYNVAAALTVCHQLGIDIDIALHSMTMRKEQDIGALRAFPISKIRGRRIEFINAMSANEPFSCLASWSRLSLDKYDADTETDTWISTIVNNRRDRASRSVLFAKTIVYDLSVDRHFFIGTNLHNMLAYIKDDCANYMKNISLWDNIEESDSISSTPSANFLRLAKKFRITTSYQALIKKLTTILSASSIFIDVKEVLKYLESSQPLEKLFAQHPVSSEPTSVIKFCNDCFLSYKEYSDFSEILANLSATSIRDKQLDIACKKLLLQWFDRKLVLIHNPFAPAEDVIQALVKETPPGFLNRVVGIQNIRQAGLPFVYAALDWDVCYRLCQKIHDQSDKVVTESLHLLLKFENLNSLCHEAISETLDYLETEKPVIYNKYIEDIEKLREKIDINIKGDHRITQFSFLNRLVELFITGIENLIMPFRAISHRKTASTIYQDLQDKRISNEMAQTVLRYIFFSEQAGTMITKLKKYLVTKRGLKRRTNGQSRRK